MTLSLSYIAPLINFKVSYKDAYKKRASLRSGEPNSYRFASTPLAIAKAKPKKISIKLTIREGQKCTVTANNIERIYLV